MKEGERELLIEGSRGTTDVAANRFKTAGRTNEIRVVEHFSVDTLRRLRRKWRRRFYSPAHGPLRAKTISPPPPSLAAFYVVKHTTQ